MEQTSDTLLKDWIVLSFLVQIFNDLRNLEFSVWLCSTVTIPKRNLYQLGIIKINYLIGYSINGCRIDIFDKALIDGIDSCSYVQDRLYCKVKQVIVVHQ